MAEMAAVLSRIASSLLPEKTRFLQSKDPTHNATHHMGGHMNAYECVDVDSESRKRPKTDETT